MHKYNDEYPMTVIYNLREIMNTQNALASKPLDIYYMVISFSPMKKN